MCGPCAGGGAGGSLLAGLSDVSHGINHAVGRGRNSQHPAPSYHSRRGPAARPRTDARPNSPKSNPARIFLGFPSLCPAKPGPLIHEGVAHHETGFTFCCYRCLFAHLIHYRRHSVPKQPAWRPALSCQTLLGMGTRLIGHQRCCQLRSRTARSPLRGITINHRNGATSHV